MDARMLICADRSPSRDALVLFFARCGFYVATASNGEECLEKAKMLRPDVLVADVETPWAGAAAIVLAFPQKSGFKVQIPAVLIIGNATPRVLSECTGVSASSCFQKPLPMERLLDRVGLAIALIDLTKKGYRQSNGARRSRPLTPRHISRKQHAGCAHVAVV